MAKEMGNTTEAHLSGPGSYQEEGVGNTEMPYREATRKGKFPGDNSGPSRSQGEVPGTGSIYAAMLNERPNISNPRNMGPTRAPSRSGGTEMSIVGMETRKTGKL